MYTLQHCNVSSYFTPGAQGASRHKAATWCKVNLEHPRHSPSPKQKVLNGSPRGLEQDSPRLQVVLAAQKETWRQSLQERGIIVILKGWIFWNSHSVLSDCNDLSDEEKLPFFFFWYIRFLYSTLPYFSPHTQGNGGITNTFNFSKISWET